MFHQFVKTFDWFCVCVCDLCVSVCTHICKLYALVLELNKCSYRVQVI